MIKIKKWLCLVLCLALLLTLLPRMTLTAHAATYSGSCGDNATYTLDDKGTLRITGSGTVDNPGWSAYRDKVVRVEVSGPSKLEDSLFGSHPNLKTVVLGDSVQTVGDYCFAAEAYKKTALESVQFGSGIREIGVGAFYGAKDMTKVIIHDLESWCAVELKYSTSKYEVDSATSPLCYGADLILNGKPVTEVVIPDSITRIGPYAFAYCKSLKKVTIPESVQSIGVFAFLDTPVLSSVTFLGHAPEPDFYYFSSFSYGSGIFTNNYKINGGQAPVKLYIHHPAGDLTYTNRIRNLYCTNYSAKDNPGEDPNEDWYDLFLLKNSDTYFSDYVVWQDPDPNMLVHGACGENLFWTLDKQGVLTISGTGEFDLSSYRFKWADYRSKIKNVIIADGVASIPDDAFAFCTSMKTVTIPDSVTSIGEQAFYGCVSLTGVTIPESVTSIGYIAFFNCNLTSIIIPAGVADIGSFAFGFYEEYLEEVDGYAFFPKPGFVVYGYTGTAAQTYAADYGLTFKARDPASGFCDVSTSAYYYQPMLWALEQGITNGTSEVTFSPKKTCTRGQVVTFLWNALEQPEPDLNDNPFVDIKSGKYYTKPVLWAYQTGVTTGTDPTHFKPGGECTRGQVVTFLWKAMGSPEPASTNNPFSDVKSGKYYYKAVLWAVENGITSGTSATTFSPNKTCTRGQVVTFLYNTLAK